MSSWRAGLSVLRLRRRILRQERRRADDIARDHVAADEVELVKANPFPFTNVG